MTQEHVARRMGLTRQAIGSAEAAELDDSIKLGRLRAAAEALGCELEYVLIPQQPLEQMIANQARRRAEQKLGRVNLSQALEASAVSSDSMVNDLAREFEMNRPSDLWDD
jgi:predicted DNA-binding mobile mystery protein A